MGAALLATFAAPALADGTHAFTLIPMRPDDELAAGYPGSSWTLVDVVRINNNGDILAIFNDGNKDMAWRRTAPSVGSRWNDGSWTQITNGNGDPTFGWDFNDAGSVVGEFVDSTQGDTVRGMEWIPPSSFFGWFDEGAIYGINNSHELCGCELDVNNWIPVSRVGGISFWQDLPEMSTWDGHCAYALSDARFDASSVRYLHVVGMAKIGLQQISRAVAWQFRGSNVYLEELDGGTGSLDWGPFPVAVNSKGIIAGWFWSQNGTGNRLPMAWVPDSDFGMNWDEKVFTGSDNVAYDLNESGEMLTDNGIWAWNGSFGSSSDFTFIDIPDHVNLPQDADPATLSLRSINDAGVVVGMIDIDNDPTIVVIYPHDMDNNDVPDYREIADGSRTDSDGNLIPDDIEGLRVGLYAVGSNPSEQASDVPENIKAIRYHSDYSQLEKLAAGDSDTCQKHFETFTILGGTGGASGDPKEIIYLVRTQRPFATGQDYIPTGGDRRQKLNDLFCFVYKYAEWIDYIQFGNEIFGGPGEYWINDGAGGYLLSQAPPDKLEQACHDVFEWMDAQAVTAQKASAMAGRPIRIISPSLTIGLVNTASAGDLSNPCFDLQCTEDRSAFSLDCVIEYANRYNAFTDIHLHYFNTTQFGSAVDTLLSPGLNQWPAPEFVTCMEWSPKPTNDWLTFPDNETEYKKYFSDAVPPNDPWDVFVENWAEEVFPPSEFSLSNDLTKLSSEGFMHACYGPFKQENIDPQKGPGAFQLIAVRANKVISDPRWMTNYQPPQLTTYILGELEAAAVNYAMTWDFHDDSISIICDCD